MPSKNKGNKYKLTRKGKKKVEDDMFCIKENCENQKRSFTEIAYSALYELKVAAAKQISEKTGIKTTSIGAVITNGLKNEEIEKVS